MMTKVRISKLILIRSPLERIQNNGLTALVRKAKLLLDRSEIKLFIDLDFLFLSPDSPIVTIAGKQFRMEIRQTVVTTSRTVDVLSTA